MNNHEKSLIEVAVEMANDLYAAGGIDADTAREYESACVSEDDESQNE